jgi:hypothetical protein
MTPDGVFLRPESDVPFVRTLAQIRTVRFPRLDVAPEGFSGLRCAKGHFFPHTARWRVTAPLCEACGERGDQKYVAVVAEGCVLIESPTLVYGAIWWHSTDAGNQFLPDSRFIHVGSQRAAELRAQALSWPGGSYEMWTLRVCPGTVIASDVVMANSNVDGENVLAESVAADGVVRYVNGREDAGSVSLVGRSSGFKLITSETVRVPT